MQTRAPALESEHPMTRYKYKPWPPIQQVDALPTEQTGRRLSIRGWKVSPDLHFAISFKSWDRRIKAFKVSYHYKSIWILWKRSELKVQPIHWRNEKRKADDSRLLQWTNITWFLFFCFTGNDPWETLGDYVVFLWSIWIRCFYKSGCGWRE